MKLGSGTIDGLYIGSSAADKLYLGSDLVFEAAGGGGGGAAPVVESFSTGTVAGNHFSASVTKPSGVLENEWLYLFISTNRQAEGGITPPAGFALVGTVGSEAATVTQFNASAVYGKQASASEPSSYSWSSAGRMSTSTSIMLRVSGGGGVNAEAMSYDGGSYITSANTPTVTTTSANCLIVCVAAWRGQGAVTPDASLDSVVYLQSGGSSTSTCSQTLATIEQAAPAAVPAYTFTRASDVYSDVFTRTIAIEPA